MFCIAGLDIGGSKVCVDEVGLPSMDESRGSAVSSPDGLLPDGLLDGLLDRGMTVLPLGILVEGSLVTEDSENRTTPALRAISCSPSCQCMASIASHGIAISSATFAHISALNLQPRISKIIGSKSLPTLGESGNSELII
jgi:hypothetical protein